MTAIRKAIRTQLKDQLKEKTKEALSSVLPISAVVLVLSATLTPISTDMLLLFILGAMLLIAGMGVFSLGADMAMTPLGQALGARVTASRKIYLAIPVFFLLGVLITVAEPDLTVLADQVPAIPNPVLIWTVAVGVGLLLTVALLRTLFRIPLNLLLTVLYIGVFALSLFAPRDFLAVAFDSGGVTTGPITVPFILALGVGLASIRGDRDAQDDSFGMVAIASVGPILAVLLLGICFNPSTANYEAPVADTVSTSQEVFRLFGHGLQEYAGEVATALLPIFAVFLLLQVLTRCFQKHAFIRAVVGFVYTLIGLILFLTGVNVGFLPTGYYLGQTLAQSMPQLLIVLGLILGWFIVQAEPAVHVLTEQVEEVTAGAISRRAMLYSLSAGVAISIGLAMARILYSIPLYAIVVPGYAVALILSFIVPPIFTGIAFDSGGVASGPMTATFLLPMGMGACMALGGDILTDAFGLVALVAMTPLITIQLLGLYYMRVVAKQEKEDAALPEPADDELIAFDEEES